MKVIGLTGGIASGKSTVSELIQKFGGIVIDADIVAREVVAKGEPALEEIVNFFGKDILNNNGSLNRKHLGSIVFEEIEKLKVLNHITHPRISERIKSMVNYYDIANRYSVIFIDAALLIEMNMNSIVDEVWLVVTNREIQIERLKKRDNLTTEEAVKRINTQIPFEEKKPYANIIIDNSGNMEELKEQVVFQLKRVFGGA